MAIALPVPLTDGPASISAIVSCNETCRAALNDVASVLVSFSVTDEISPTLSDSSSAVATLAATDSAGVVGSESATVIDPNTASIAASDTATVVLISESFTLSSASIVQDTITAGLTDSLNTLQVFTGQSTNNVSVSDSLTVRLNGIEQPAPTIPVTVSDSSRVDLSESSTRTIAVLVSDTTATRITDTALSPIVSISTADSARLIVSEPGDQQSHIGVLDNAVVAVNDTARIEGSFAFNVSDSIAVGISGATSFGTFSIGATDSCRIVASELLTNSASVTAIENLGTTLSEVSSMLKDVSASETLAIRFTDTASPIFDSFIDVTASDSCAVQVTESVTELISFLHQLTASDSGVVGSSEAIAEQFVQAVASDQQRIAVDDFADIWNSPSVTDTLKIGTTELGLAIPRVTVNIETFTDDTLLGSTDGTASVEVIYEAIEKTTSDGLGVQCSEDNLLQYGYNTDDLCLVGVGDTVAVEVVPNASPNTWNGNTATEHRNDKPKPWKYIFTDKLNW